MGALGPQLVYVSDSEPGIIRKKHGRGFRYVHPDGTTIARGKERRRLEALGVPPAYEDVWMCPKPNGHLQATGRDAAKRKQYRYHVDWTKWRAETKFRDLPDFADALPTLRRAVARDLKAPTGSEAFCLAAAATMIDRLALRVGDEGYTRQNGSYGALTLRNRHMRSGRDGFMLRYTAKGGKRVRKQIGEVRLQKVLSKVSDLPGATLLSWTDEDGQTRGLTSQALNAYLADMSGDAHVTAKTFRTWAGTVAAFEVAETGGATIKDMSTAASERLHNTPTIARTSYIHPAVIDLAGQGPLGIQTQQKSGLFASETRLLSFLRR